MVIIASATVVHDRRLTNIGSQQQALSTESRTVEGVDDTDR